MLYVDKNNNIRLTRGDTAKFIVSVQNESIKEPYNILSSDTLTMTIKDSIRDGEPCIQKTITGSNAFHILPSDTSSLNFGKYIYDIQLTTKEGDVYTVVAPSTFELMEEVTY